MDKMAKVTPEKMHPAKNRTMDFGTKQGFYQNKDQIPQKLQEEIKDVSTTENIVYSNDKLEAITGNLTKLADIGALEACEDDLKNEYSLGCEMLAEQDKKFEEYFTRLNQDKPEPLARDSFHQYVFENIDVSKIKFTIAEGKDGGSLTDQIKELQSMDRHSQEYADHREYLLQDMTGKFFGFGFTRLGDLEDHGEGYFYNNVQREHIQELITHYLAQASKLGEFPQ